MSGAVEFAVYFAFVEDVGAGNVEDGLLGIGGVCGEEGQEEEEAEGLMEA